MQYFRAYEVYIPMKLRFVFFIFSLLSSFYSVAQISISEYKHDFGIVEEDSKLWFELEVTNKGSKDSRLLRVSNPDNEFEFKFSNMITPGSGTSKIRIQFNPKEKGKRKIPLQLFFDNETIELKIVAHVKYTHRDYTPCPDFDRTSSIRSFETTFRVLDKSTKEPISNAIITISNNQSFVYELECDKKGWIKESIPLSFYFMHVEAENYLDFDSSSYVNARNNEFVFYLEPLEATVAIEETSEKVPIETIPDPIITETENEEVIIEEEDDVQEEVAVQEELEIDEDENTEFSKREYAPNNIVFLMDVSTSMKKEDRLDLLKKALLSLTDMMRDNDVISLITYASKTEILIEGHNMGDKETIKSIIANIDGKGTTAGGKGIKKAYAIAKKHEIKNGNNHIYIATDGAFNKNDDKLAKLIARQSSKGYNLSVISLKSSEFATKKMKELTAAGGGDFVDIQDMDNTTERLKALIKKQSKIE